MSKKYRVEAEYVEHVRGYLIAEVYAENEDEAKQKFDVGEYEEVSSSPIKTLSYEDEIISIQEN